MLKNHTQEQILLTLAGDLRNFTTFKNEGVSLKEEMFSEGNKKKFQALQQAKMNGYDSLTIQFADEHGIDIPFNTIKQDDFIDICRTAKQEITDKNKMDAFHLVNGALEEYMKSNELDEIEMIRKIQEKVQLIQTVQVKETGRTMDEIIERKFTYEEKKASIPTFLKELDKDILLGGFERSALHIISGFPGNGKTTLAVQIGVAAAMRNHKVLFVSLEQKEEKILANALSVASHMEEENRQFWNISNITKEEMEDKKRRAKDVVSEHIRDFFIIDETRYASQELFIERIRKACLVEKYDMVIIDNFQNGPRLQGRASDEQSFSQLADALLDIALLSNTVLMPLSQLTMTNGKPETKYSRRINENATTNLVIELITPDEDDVDTLAKSKIIAKKARSGIQGAEETFHFNGAKSIIGSFSLPTLNREEQEKFKIEKSTKNTGLPF